MYAYLSSGDPNFLYALMNLLILSIYYYLWPWKDGNKYNWALM